MNQLRTGRNSGGFANFARAYSQCPAQRNVHLPNSGIVLIEAKIAEVDIPTGKNDANFLSTEAMIVRQ